MKSFNDIQSRLVSLYNTCFYTFNDELEQEIAQEIDDVTLLKDNIISSASSNQLKSILKAIQHDKVMTDVIYGGYSLQGCRWQWMMADLERSEELVHIAQNRLAACIIQQQWKKIYKKKCDAASKIQKHWRHANAAPSFKVCQNRLQWEFVNI